MKIEAIGFTKEGCALACTLRDALGANGHVVRVSGPSRLADTFPIEAYRSLDEWTRLSFEDTDALLFVSAVGIAVRAIAPYVHDKFFDPAVVAIDESAAFAVPLLSGHVGGANNVAREIAAACGAQAVITTATDVHELFAVDEWARRHNLAILDRGAAKEFSAALLAGESVGFASDFPLEGALPQGLVYWDSKETGRTYANEPHRAGAFTHGQQGAHWHADACQAGENVSLGPVQLSANASFDQGRNGTNGLPDSVQVVASVSLDPDKTPFERTLRLVPRAVTVGIGCKRNTPSSCIEELLFDCLTEAHVAREAIDTLSSISAKSNEAGLLEVAARYGWRTRFFSAEELAAVPGKFASSEFVEKTVGVDNVCERAACAAGNSLLLSRRSRDGVTIALGLAPLDLRFD